MPSPTTFDLAVVFSSGEMVMMVMPKWCDWSFFVGNIWNRLQLLLVIHIFPQDGDTSTTDLDGFLHLLAVKI